MPTTWLDSVLRQTRRLGDFPYPHWAAVFLNNPVRRWVGRPGDVVEGLGLSGSERVLELGPGPGYFSVELARRVPARWPAGSGRGVSRSRPPERRDTA